MYFLSRTIHSGASTVTFIITIDEQLQLKLRPLFSNDV